MGFYHRYMNLPRKMRDRPGIWRAKLSDYAPGNIGDPKNRQRGGMRRFERWQKLPVRAWKLYWRQSKRRALTPNLI